MKADRCIVCSMLDVLLASHIIGCTNTSCSQCFVWSFSSELPWNFLIIHRGGLWHFPRHTLLYLFTHTPLLHYPPADERPETKNLSELVGFCHLEAWCVCFRYNEKLFLTVLTCPPRMMLWTKRVFGWKMAEPDCETLRTWNTGSVDAKVWQQW